MNVPVLYNKARVDREYDRATVTDIVVPEGVARIDDRAFFNCLNLVSISLPNSLTSIGRDAFEYCRSLRHLTIPPLVTIGYSAFDNCSSLSSVHLPPTATIIDDMQPFFACTIVNNLAVAQNLSRIDYIRLQYEIKEARIILRIAVHMCTNSKIRYDFNVPMQQAGNRSADRVELHGVLALRLLNDDVWREIVEFL